MSAIPLEDLCSRFNATPREKLASLREVGGTEQQFATANDHSKRATDRRLESYTYSSLLDLTTIGDPEQGALNERSIRLIVVGISGAGKSATGNTLLQRDEFHVSSSAMAQTMDTEMRSAEVGGRMLEVVDTAGSWNPPKNGQQPPDNELHVLVINLASPRFDDVQLKQLRRMKDSRGRSILKNRLCFLILTHASEALSSVNLTEYVHDIQKDPLGQLITQDLQGWRVLAVNNNSDTEYEQRRRDENITRLIHAVNMRADRSKPWYSLLKVRYIPRQQKIIILLLLTVTVVFVYWYMSTDGRLDKMAPAGASGHGTTEPTYRGHHLS